MFNEDATLNELKLINIATFKATLGIAHNKFYNLRNTDKNFPRPVALGRRPMYRLAEVKTYIETLQSAPMDMSTLVRQPRSTGRKGMGVLA